MIVTIFGGSQPKPEEGAYIKAYNLGALLARAGYTICTGGYVGTMEAASRGAAEAGGHVIGATCREIESWRPIKANSWVKEEWIFDTLSERLTALIKRSDAAIALPGGIGTLAEIMMAWNHLAIRAISPRPLILIGDGWKNTINTFMHSQAIYIAPEDRNSLQYVCSNEDAIKLIADFSQNNNKRVLDNE